MEVKPGVTYDIEMPPDRRQVLLAPYEIIVAVDGMVILEFGRFSFGLLGNVRLLANKEPGCVLRVGAFCEAATDALIIVGGEHWNGSLFNFTFSSHSEGMRAFIDKEDMPLVGVRPAEPIEIGDNVTLSARSTVLSGARIETGSVIGAGAVVASSCAAYGVYGGVPARRLRDRFSPERQALHSALRLADVAAHDVPRLPRLLNRLERGEIDLDEYRAAVSFLPARPTVHIEGARAARDAVAVSKITGYSLGGQPVTDPQAVAMISEYFGQIQGTGTVRWRADIFHAAGLY